MPLFGRKQAENADGHWANDLRHRFDQRWFGPDGIPTARVRWRGRELLDPFPPGCVLVDVPGQQARARTKLADTYRDLGTLPIAEAAEYFERKLTAVLSIFAPDLTAEQRADLELSLGRALSMPCADYLESYDADASWREEFQAWQDGASAPDLIAWFWAVDPVFRLPGYMDEFLLVGTQLILRNRGQLPPGTPVTSAFG